MVPVTDRAATRNVAAPSLYIRSGRKYTLVPADVLLDHVRQWAAESFRSCAPVLARPELIEAFLLTKLATREHEVFALILLDMQSRLIEYVELSHGTLRGANVHSREVVKTALKHNAASVILAHNHPSGRAEPSQEDVLVTRNLRNALALVDIRVIDHLVVGEKVTSFVQRGLLR
jgi:DNA repair protein RadC